MAKNEWIIVVALLAIIAYLGNPMTMISTDRSVELPVGGTVDIPFKYKYDNQAFLGSSTQARIVVDYKGYSSPDEYPLTWAVTAGTTYDKSFTQTVKGPVGTKYDMVIEVEEKSGSSWVSSNTNSFTIHVTVVEPEIVSDEDVQEDLGELDFNAVLFGATSIGIGLLALVGIALLYRRKK